MSLGLWIFALSVFAVTGIIAANTMIVWKRRRSGKIYDEK